MSFKSRIFKLFNTNQNKTTSRALTLEFNEPKLKDSNVGVLGIKDFLKQLNGGLNLEILNSVTTKSDKIIMHETIPVIEPKLKKVEIIENVDTDISHIVDKCVEDINPKK